MANSKQYLMIGITALSLNCASNNKPIVENELERAAQENCLTPAEFHQGTGNGGKSICVEGMLNALYGNEPGFTPHVVVYGGGDSVDVKIDDDAVNDMRRNLGRNVRVMGKFFYDADSMADMPYRNKLDASKNNGTIEFID